MQHIILYVLNMKERDKSSIKGRDHIVLILYVFQTSKLDDGT